MARPITVNATPCIETEAAFAVSFHMARNHTFGGFRPANRDNSKSAGAHKKERGRFSRGLNYVYRPP
jgi:hypothetical protein